MGIEYSLVGFKIYEGSFKKTKRSGPGCEYYSNGKLAHVGNWANGFKQGDGKKYDIHGVFICSGVWHNDYLILVTSFDPEFTTGSAKSPNIITFANESYFGDVSHGKSHGQGFMFMNICGMKIYDGGWKYGKQDGFGVEYHFSASNSNNEHLVQYIGSFSKDQWGGFGIQKYRNGKTLAVGKWKGRCPQGFAVSYSSDGTIQTVG